jgi:hypothetical protein
MTDQDPHRLALISIARAGRISLIEAAIALPACHFPLEAHLRVTTVSGTCCPTFTISHPAMEIGMAHISTRELSSTANRLLAQKLYQEMDLVEPLRLNTARTIAKYRLTEAPSAHDLMEVINNTP